MVTNQYRELGEYLKIFQPIYARRLEETKLESIHFAYYTSASTGINILRPSSLDESSGLYERLSGNRLRDSTIKPYDL